MVLALRTTLALFFRNSLGLFEGDTKWSSPQILLVDALGLEAGRGGSGLSISFTSYSINWLKKHVGGQNSISFPSVLEVMQKTHTHLGVIGRNDRFEASLNKNGYLCLTVPGDATYLGGAWEGGNRMRLDTHNSDSASQQLTFLAGIAALHDLILAG
jgi:hypothetical protein